MKLITVAAVSLMIAGLATMADTAVAPALAQSDLDRVNAAGREFIAAIAARDIEAMDRVWLHEPHAVFIGPLSTSVVAGWEGVRKAWQMRFGQFDRVTISATESHAQVRGKVAWAVGMERVQLLRKSGETLGFDAFVTNVFEERDGRWLLVSHHATPVFKEAK
jgi:ketosteroid isomerase-like protein